MLPKSKIVEGFICSCEATTITGAEAWIAVVTGVDIRITVGAASADEGLG